MGILGFTKAEKKLWSGATCGLLSLDQQTVQIPSLVVKEPHLNDLGAAGQFYPTFQGAGRGRICMCHGADNLKTRVFVTSLSLSMCTDFLQWTGMRTERWSVHQAFLEPMKIVRQGVAWRWCGTCFKLCGTCCNTNQRFNNGKNWLILSETIMHSMDASHPP
jgi:hypothetical protein